MLDKDLIEEQPLFYTMERNRNMWRYFETRTYHSGPSTATTHLGDGTDSLRATTAQRLRKSAYRFFL